MMSGRPFSPESLLRGVGALAFAALVFGPLASPARADTDRIEKRLWIAVGGTSPRVVKVDAFREMREDCALAAAPVVTVVEQPKAGKLVVKSAAAVGATDANGPYAACNGRKFNWTTVTFAVPAKAEGTDRAVIQAAESGGDITVYDLEIVFAKKLPAGKTSGLYEDR